MKQSATIFILVAASPAFAAGDSFFSLANTDFVVLIAFLLFVGVLFYYKVPSLLGGLLDKRAAGIAVGRTLRRWIAAPSTSSFDYATGILP